MDELIKYKDEITPEMLEAACTRVCLDIHPDEDTEDVVTQVWVTMRQAQDDGSPKL